MTAKSSSQRQATLRDRRLAEGLTEVRGIYLRTEDHAKLKQYAKKLQAKKPAPLAPQVIL